MIYWIIFHFSIILLCVLFMYAKNNTWRIIIAALICCALIYFSAFTEGIGQDHEQYLKRLQWLTSIDNLSTYGEPLFNIIAYIISKTRLSPVFFFLVSAIVTDVGIILFCYSEKKYFPYMVLLFVFIPALFQQQFNLVRQLFAIGLFYYSLRFVGVSLWRYSTCIIIGGLMHFSSLFLLPLYWILDKRFERKWIVLITIVFFSLEPLIERYVGMIDRYESYVDDMTSKTMYFSGFTIIYNILLLIFLFNNRLFKSVNPIYLNLLIFLVLFIDASYINYGYYRLALYFIPVVIYIIPFVLDKLWDKVFVLLVVSVLMVQSYTNKNKGSGMEMLPLSALFDK